VLFRVAVDEVLIDLVGEYPPTFLRGIAAKGCNLVSAVDRAGGVGR
jgi:hypothetical protein